MKCYLSFLAVALPLVGVATAQNDHQEQVLAAVIFTANGHGTPSLRDGSSILTPFGAQQLLGAGAAIRDRYVANDYNSTVVSTQITGISPDKLRNHEISVVAISDQLTSASAQAFMQGLYPPLDLLETRDVIFDETYIINDTVFEYPLGGYQYANITTLGPQDPSFIELAGNLNCPMYSNATLSLLKDDEDIRMLQDEAETLYTDLYYRVLDGIVDLSKLHLLNAYSIWELLDYLYAHSGVGHELITPKDLMRARHLADKVTFSMNSRPIFTAGHVYSRAVAGKTLAQAVARALKRNFDTRGSKNKLSLMFGHVDPMVAFASIAGLASHHQSNFYGMPNPGASMIIELFSRDTGVLDSYPDSTNDLMVRFMLRNGTNAANPNNKFVAYPMFGLGPSNTVVPYSEFISRMTTASISVSEWCLFCNSPASFCAATDESVKEKCDKKRRLGPWEGACIGAVTTAILLGFSFWSFYRFERRILAKAEERKKLEEMEAQKQAFDC